MKNSKKLIAMFVVIAMLATNIVLLFSNISKATKTNVTVVITADSDNCITLSDGVTNGQGELERKSINIYLRRSSKWKS